MKIHTWALVGAGLLVLAGCTGPTATQERKTADPIVNMLHGGILDLEGNVDELNRRIAEFQQMPPAPDPTVQELRALDLSGWHLHQQQWLVQRERLVFAVKQLQRAQAHPSEKAELWTQWTTSQPQFAAVLEDLRAQRHGLERKRIEVESQLLQRYFK